VVVAIKTTLLVTLVNFWLRNDDPGRICCCRVQTLSRSEGVRVFVLTIFFLATQEYSAHSPWQSPWRSRQTWSGRTEQVAVSESYEAANAFGRFLVALCTLVGRL